jgi:hypothetical protein
MLETVREFGEARLAESGDTDRVIDGFLAWIRDLAIRYHDAEFGPDPIPIGDMLRGEQDNLRLALRHGLTREDGASIAAASALLEQLWTLDANYVRAARLTEEVAQPLAHYRPAPEHVAFTRTAITLCALNTLGIQNTSPARMLYALRRLPPGRPDTPAGAMALVLTTPNVFAKDRAALHTLYGSPEPQVAAVAGLILSYLAEQDGELQAAIDMCDRVGDAWGTRRTPWLWILSLARRGELALRVARSEDALRYSSEGVRLLEEIGAPRDIVGVSWGMMLAHLQLGHLDEAEYWLGRVSTDNAGNPDDPDDDSDAGAAAFLLSARAELTLARGHVDEGLRLWRRAAVARATLGAPEIDEDELRPWEMETQAGALAAHAHYRRLDLVADLLLDLPRRLAVLLANPREWSPVYIVEQQLAGALLVSVGMADIAAGHGRSGVRLVALAEHFKFLPGFRPTLALADVREAAENADGPAYADAMSEYAGLSRTELWAAALAALRARPTAAGPG